MTTTTSRLLASVASAALLLGSAGGAAAERIGAVAAVNSEVIGEPPAADPRDLILGDDLVLEERIESSPIGTGQFLFLDQTALTVAPNSNIVLDRYIYDPATQTGEMAMSMTRGVLRFVGGRISKTTDAVITTPTATIGIRGGISIIIVEEDGTTRVMHIAGEYTRLTSLTGEEIVISRSNGVAEVSINGLVSYVGVADQILIRETTIALVGRGEAGQRVRPENPDVIESGVPGVISEAKGAATDDSVSTSGETESDFGDDGRNTGRTDEEVTTATAPTPGRPNPPPPALTLIEGATGSASFSGGSVPGLTSGGAGAESFVLTQIFEGSRVGVTADGETFIIPTPTTTGFFDFDAADGSASPRGALTGRGFFNRANEFTYTAFETAGGQAGAFVSGIVSPALPSAAAGTTVARLYALSDDLLSGAAAAFTDRGAPFGSDGRGDLILIGNPGGAATGGDAKALYAYLDINGAGAGQTSGFGVLTGDVVAAGKGTPDFEALFEGSFSSGAGAPTRLSTAVAPVSDGAGGTAFGEGARFLALTSFANGSGEPGRAFDADQTPTLFGTNNVANRTAVETIAAADRATASQARPGGFAAISGFDLASGETYSARSANSSGVIMTLLPEENGGFATFRLDDVFGGDSQNDPELSNLRVQFGFDDGKAATLDNRRFAMRDATPNDALEIFQSANFADVEFSGAMASADLTGDGGVFDAGTDATPEHLTWGWWAGELRAVANQTCQECAPLETDQRLHLGAWIAGDVTANAALPTSGVATFDGHAVISAVDNGRSVVDGARFDMVFDFAEEVGTTTFTGLLGADTTVAVSRGEGGGFSGLGDITVGGRDGVIGVDGAFFNDRAGNPAAAAGGSLGLRSNDGTLTGAGIFGGDRRTFTPGG
ncbi:MAG: FecR domain-containing protein [Pikeienuella sp.]|uniref:FecR domain-containing protein n=1 Tax=Pikeienuella sp. TaxID=2831957 RepID=UPI00391934A3